MPPQRLKPSKTPSPSQGGQCDAVEKINGQAQQAPGDYHVEPPASIGSRLRAQREGRGFTQNQLGSKLRQAVSKQAVAAWESGRNQLTAEQIIDLCGLLNCTADYLLGLSRESDSAKQELGMTVDQAKRALARTIGVAPARVEILIRG